jgi:hypothetical protein
LLPLDALDRRDETFRSSLERDPGPLALSLEAVGLVTPLRVQRRRGGVRLVSGFLRAEALLRLGEKEAVVEEVDGETPEDDLLLAALHENRFTRGFSWAERAWVLERALSGRPGRKAWALERLLPALGLAPAPKLLEDHLKAATMPSSVRRALIRHGCSLANALRLAAWPSEAQSSLVPVLDRVHLGENVLREVLECAGEIGLREGVSPAEVLTAMAVQDVPEARAADGVQVAERLRGALRRRRYPALAAMEEAFGRARARLGLAGEISVQPSPYFEQAGVRIHFRARTPHAFREAAERLWKAAQRADALEALFRTVDGDTS